MKFWHKLFNPHCQHCYDELIESKICNNCEYLKMQIAKLQQDNDKLLNELITPKEIINNSLEESSLPQPLNTSRFIPFSIKRQELETRDRKLANQQAEELKKNHNKNIESLEEEILSAKVDGVELSDLELEGSVRESMRESDAK